MESAMDNLARMDLASTALRPTFRTPVPTNSPLSTLLHPSHKATSKFHRTLTSTSPVMGLNPLTFNGVDLIATYARDNAATLEAHRISQHRR
ncbi:hypothetical protein M405DRAFT_811437 [Rhizopogon salebrosus TDB-379]|nr:hypothetical protein M405DRAFT_811437 [Rhizopogon salebrosus TDB-379]